MLSSADSQAAAADAAEPLRGEGAMLDRCGLGRKDGVKWYISTAFRRMSSFFLFWRLLCCLERALPEEDEAIGLAEEDAAPVRDTCAEVL